MWKLRTPFATLAVAAGVLSAACAEVPTTMPPTTPEPELFGGPAPDPDSFAGHIDRQFVSVAREVPGFGGLYYDEAGTLNIYLSPAASVRSVEAARRALGGPLGRIGVDLDAQPIRLLAGRYDFLELHALHARLRPVMSLSGVVFTDIDERRNRVSVGVENAAAAGAVEHTLQMLGDSREAVIVQETGRVEFAQTLRDRVRPVGGGLQINYPGFFCTHGFNVRSTAAPGVQGFVTAAHCTETFASVTHTPFWQPSGTVPDPTDPNYIGVEVHDADFFTAPIGSCPAGRQCRWCDAAGVRYAPGIDNAFGRIYRTTGPGSITIDPANQTFEITSVKPFPFVGDNLHKVGRTTGWTQGSATQTCVNVNVAGTDITFLCQDVVSGNPQLVGSGDSGAPVFQREQGPENAIRLAGILWGIFPGQDEYVFCAMDNLQFENPGPVPWQAFPGRL